MPKDDGTIFDVDTGPRIIRGQVQQLSSFVQQLTGEKHRVLDKFLDTKVPVIDQERYEVGLYYFYKSAAAGAGGTVTFTFNPAPPFPSHIIRRLWVVTESTASANYKARVYKQFTSGNLQPYNVAALQLPSGDHAFELIGENGTVHWDGTNVVDNMKGAPVPIYRNYRKTEDQTTGRERFDVIGSGLTLAETIQVYGEVEIIPDLAVAHDMSELVEAAAT